MNQENANSQNVNNQNMVNKPQQSYVQPSNVQSNVIPREYQPISMWGYFGYEILFAIPCIGFILLLVFAFGGTTNINLRNFARSYFCFLIIVLILGAILVATGVGLTAIASR
jgi:uncharacterized integral membrane protein